MLCNSWSPTRGRKATPAPLFEKTLQQKINEDLRTKHKILRHKIWRHEILRHEILRHELKLKILKTVAFVEKHLQPKVSTENTTGISQPNLKSNCTHIRNLAIFVNTTPTAAVP